MATSPCNGVDPVEKTRATVGPDQFGEAESSASKIGRYLSSISFHSLAGSESATIPTPANRVAFCGVRSADRSATAKSPPPAASMQPIGAAYQPRSNDSVSRMVASAASGEAPDSWRWVKRLCQREHVFLTR